MTALSIRHMHFTMREHEVLQAERDAAEYACLPAELREESHYWFVERKSKSRKGQWIFVRDFFGSKRKAAELFVKHYRNQPIRHRLVHKLKYGT
jgi:hypothetical protein